MQRRLWRGSRRPLGILAAILVSLSPAAGADEPRAEPAPPALDAALTADTIYERVLANRFTSSLSELAMHSGDRGGREQPIGLLLLWRRYGEATPEAAEGVLSRTLVRYTEPSDVRGTGYLVINKKDAPNDQFVYLESMRRTRRVNLRSTGIVGTDFSAEDIVPREMDDADYTRKPDSDVQGTPCYLIEAIPKPAADSQYSRFWIYVESAHYVPLRTRYWDAAGVEIKELLADPGSIREIEGIWLPTASVMRHLPNETYTRLRVVRLAPNPEIPEKFFTQRQLETRRMRLPDAVVEAAVTLE